MDDISMKDISPLMLEKLKRDLKAKGLSETKIYQALALIKAICRKAKGWELYEGRIPTESIKFPKPENKRLRFLNHN